MTEHRLGVILAGGAGARVGGADKGLLLLRGRPLIEHVLDTLRPQCDEILIVANRNRDAYARYATVIGDELEGHAGPLAGIVAALNHVSMSFRASPSNLPDESEDTMLTLPVDCPSPPRDLAVRLHDALRGEPHAACAFVRDGQSAQPLFAMYRLRDIEVLLESARRTLASHASVLRWHAEIGARAVDFPGGTRAFDNLNTPEEFLDYERAHAEP